MPNPTAWVRQISSALETLSHGWRTADLRRFARKTSREILKAEGMETLVRVADQLFTGELLEEKIFAVLLLENSTGKLGEPEFRMFDGWLDRISSWADHDGLVHYLIGPMIVAEPKRAMHSLRWARSQNRWRRRAAAVSLIHSARRRLLFPQIVRVSEALLSDTDDMVQKGVGWLLREAAKADPRTTVPYLLRIRDRTSRLVLRTACETLPAGTRARVLERHC